MGRRVKNKKETSELTPLELKEFDDRFEELVDRLWTIQDRINELKEFEKQWKGVFDILKDKSGKECHLHIQNSGAYRTFHWDKYQVLVSDLHSLYENELNELHSNAVIRQSIHHAKLFKIEKYINHEKKIKFIGNPKVEITDEMKRRIEEESKIEDANRTVNYIKESLNDLFPKISSDYIVTDDDIKHLLSRVNSICKRIKGTRHYFNHKYEESVAEKYKGFLDGFSLEKIETISDELFGIVSNLGLVVKQSSYGKSDFDYTTDISNQIDLILFGSIHTAISRFYEVANKEDFYWNARDKYFNSEKILEIISN